MKNKFGSFILLAIVAIGLAIGIQGCGTPHLEKGGVYAPTNSVGEVVYTETELALADESYKLAYTTAIDIFQFEKDSREQVKQLSPATYLAVKHNMDDARTTFWDIDKRWTTARKAYRANPTPNGLTTLQSVLAEIQRVIPAVQSQLTPVNKLVTQPKTTTP